MRFPLSAFIKVWNRLNSGFRTFVFMHVSQNHLMPVPESQNRLLFTSNVSKH